MFAVPARLVSAVSNAAWSLSATLNAILPKGELPNPSWAPNPAAEEPRENSNDDGRSEEDPIYHCAQIATLKRRTR